MTTAKNEHWKRAYIGNLPPDFLRVPGMSNQRDTAAMAYATRPQIGYQYMSPPNPNIVGSLTITVVQAKLARNYGLTRMDPYCRLRVGHFVYGMLTKTRLLLSSY
jgi:toll-interacting protein